MLNRLYDKKLFFWGEKSFPTFIIKNYCGQLYLNLTLLLAIRGLSQAKDANQIKKKKKLIHKKSGVGY